MQTELDKLKAWLERIHERVSTIRLDAYLFAELRRMIRKNPALHRPSLFYDWLIRQYGAGIASAVRREVDEDSRTDSFVRLLRRLKGASGLLSRERYRSRRGPNEAGVADRAYDRIVGRGKARPSGQQFEREIARLKTKAQRLVAYVDRHIAHIDQTPASSLARFSDVELALRPMERLLQKYYQLLHAAHLEIGKAHILGDWRAIFAVPWMRVPGTSLSNTRLQPAAPRAKAKRRG